MVLEMRHIVVGEEAECDRRISTDRALNVTAVFRDLSDHVSKVVIVSLPEGREVMPGTILAMLTAHPLVLRISWEHKCRLLQCPDESLMIIGRRINQVPNDLLGRPLARRVRPSGFEIRD
jgi:hypothetical protein